MVLNHFVNCELSRKQEMKIYHSSKASIVEGTHFSGIQNYADKFNLETLLVHSEKDMFSNNGFFDKTTFSKLMSEYKSFLVGQSKLAKVLNGTPITEEYIRSLLQDDYVVILAGALWGGVLHATLIVGYNNGNFFVFDPIGSKEKWVPVSAVIRSSKTPIGSWLLAIRTEKNTDESKVVLNP